MPFTHSAGTRPLTGAIRAALFGVALIAAPVASTIALADTAASTATQQYDIPAGPLGRTLSSFAVSAGIALSFEPALTDGLDSPGISGRYSVSEALDKLLAGSGLQLVPRADGSYTLRKLPAGADQATVLRAVNVKAANDNAGQTEGSGSYTVSRLGVGGRMGESLRETPRSVSVITRQQLDDQRMINLYDAILQLPGVTTTFASGNSPDASFYTRGNQLNVITVDGLRVSMPSLGSSRGGGSNSGMAKYDNVQLLRGPDSLFSGNSEPSGSINLVRKKPTDNFQLKTAVSFGSWSNRAAEVDVSGSLLDEHHVRGRAVIAGESTDHFYESDINRKSTLYGIIDADLWQGATLAVGASRDTQHGGPDQPPGLPRYADGKPLNASRSTGYPDWARRSYDTDNVFAQIEQQFNTEWTLKAGVSKTRYRSGHNVMSYYDGVVDPQTLIGDGAVYTTRADWDAEVKAANVNLIGDLHLGGLHQQFAFGVDYSDSSQYSLVSYHDNPLPVPNWADFDPDNFAYPSTMGPGWDNDSRQKQQGIFAYGNFQIYGPWSVVLGGRYASIEGWTSGFHDVSGDCATWANSCGALHGGHSVKNVDNDGIFTPYFALMVDLADNWTAYVTRAESYEDQSNYYTESYQSLDPTEGESWEFGVKGEFFDGRLNTNVTLYHSKRDNYAVSVSYDEIFSQGGRDCCYSSDGEFISQGVELEISGALTPEWQINAGYTYDDNKTEYGNDDGKRYASYTPKHIVRLWTSYDLHSVLNGLRVGGGVQAQSSTFQSGTINTWNPTGGLNGNGAFDGPPVDYRFSAPGYALWNAFAEYRLTDHWKAALNINNLFDKRYLQVVGTTSGDNYYGAPRNAVLTLRGEF